MKTAAIVYVLNLVIWSPSGKQVTVQMTDLPTYEACLRAGAQYMDRVLKLRFGMWYICDQSVPTVLIAKAPTK